MDSSEHKNLARCTSAAKTEKRRKIDVGKETNRTDTGGKLRKL